MEWLIFLVGTPRRAGRTLAALLLLGLVHTCAPGLIGTVVLSAVGGLIAIAAGLVAELLPLLFHLAFLLVVLIGLRMAIGGGKNRR